MQLVCDIQKGIGFYTKGKMTWIIFILIILSTRIISEATPQVKLLSSTSGYFSDGGTLILLCQVDVDVNLASVTFNRDEKNQIWVTNTTSQGCAFIKYNNSDNYNYTLTCDQRRSFTLMKYRVSSEDHNKSWGCIMFSDSNGPCSGNPNPCISQNIKVILQVPVSRVQITNSSGQTLTSRFNAIRGRSVDIICSTAPYGSRPLATFLWYKRQGSQPSAQIMDQNISSTPDPVQVPSQPQQSDLLISYSTLTLIGDASYQDIYIFCTARDESSSGNYIHSGEVQLSIVYPPVVHLLSDYPLYNVTEGRHNFSFICNVVEANPLPQANGYSWFHKTSIIQGQTSSSYTLPSVQRADAGEYKCAARNDYGNGTSVPLDLIVQYPPNITVMLTSVAMQNQPAILRCEAQGVPAETIFYPWVHMWEGVPVRTGLEGKTNSTHSILTLESLSLESMGTYVCTASNGIMGISGKINQTGLETVHVKGKANILVDNATFVGEIGLLVNMSISFYSDPAIESFTIRTNGRNVMNTSRTQTYLSKDFVNYQFYNKMIRLDAQMAHCVILNVTAEDFDNYTLELSNSIGITSFLFHLDPFGPPLQVRRFYFNRFIDDKIELHFDAGFNGGPDQTFVIEYMTESNFYNAWKNTSVSELSEKESQYRFSNGTFFVKVTKPSPGSYVYRIYSWNVKGKSPFSDNITVTIHGAVENEQNSVVEAVAGGVGAAVFVIAVIILVLILLRRGSVLKKKSIAENIDSELINRERPESGLVGNPVYDSSGPTHGSASGTIPTDDEHAYVAKPKKNDDLSNLYAQVDKTEKDRRKGTTKATGKQGKTSKGDFYENTNLALKSSAENVYENPGHLAARPNSSENAYENPETSASKGQLVNQDGLLYADVILGPPTARAGKPIIHGQEDHTEYADIAFGKRGEPLPETDQVKENGGTNK